AVAQLLRRAAHQAGHSGDLPADRPPTADRADWEGRPPPAPRRTAENGMSEIQEITKYIAAEYLPGTAPEEIDPSYDLFENGVVHSLQLLRLIDWLRSHYGIPADEL